MKTKILVSHLLILTAGTMFATASFAQDRHPSKNSKFWLDVGGYYATESIVLSVESDILGENDPIDLERDIDFGDPNMLPMIEFGWHFGEKWSVALQYFDTEKSKSFSIEEEIEWDDLVFEVGVDAKIGTGASVTRLVVDRILHESENHRVNLALGLHLLSVDAFIEGIARLDDESTEFRRSRVETKFPLPNIGFSYLYSPSRTWASGWRSWCFLPGSSTGCWRRSADEVSAMHLHHARLSPLLWAARAGRCLALGSTVPRSPEANLCRDHRSCPTRNRRGPWPGPSGTAHPR